MSEWYETRRTRSKPEKMARPKRDRRILNNVPDNEQIRSGSDRRGRTQSRSAQTKQAQDEGLQDKIGLRYIADFDVKLIMRKGGKKKIIAARATDISTSGILVCVDELPANLEGYDRFELQFDLPSGTMREGFESYVKTNARLVRSFTQEGKKGSEQMLAFEFKRNLFDYYEQKRWGYSVSIASTFLFVSILIVVLMRVESILYFKYNWFLYLYSLIAALFLLSRYLFGALYRNVPINPEFTPGVTIVIPCFNEEEWIQRTILSCVNQDYPVDKLEIIVVDDCSTDTSWKQINTMVNRLMEEADRFKIAERVRAVRLPKNSGKRVALATGVDMAKHDLVVFVDSDSFLEGKAIRNLVQPFQDPKMGGVTGRTDVENKYTNALTKLQTVRYYVAFRIMKAAESFFDSVTCLSGPLSCYRKDLVLRFKDEWLNQKFLGHPATFGDDRSLTNYIMKNYRTAYQDNAICSTVVPSVGKQFLNQQMRWKRSWLRESLRVAGFIWRKEPFMALFFYVGFIVPIAAPIVFIYNLVYIPIAHDVIPFTFLIGLFVMAMLLSFSHLIFQKSRIWMYGFLFCVFYELVLLWQMPVAWFTFAVSKWGTRDTPEDIKAKNKRKQLKLEKQKAKRPMVVADAAHASMPGQILAGQPLATRAVQYTSRQQRSGQVGAEKQQQTAASMEPSGRMQPPVENTAGNVQNLRTVQPSRVKAQTAGFDADTANVRQLARTAQENSVRPLTIHVENSRVQPAVGTADTVQPFARTAQAGRVQPLTADADEPKVQPPANHAWNNTGRVRSLTGDADGQQPAENTGRMQPVTENTAAGAGAQGPVRYTSRQQQFGRAGAREDRKSGTREAQYTSRQQQYGRKR